MSTTDIGEVGSGWAGVLLLGAGAAAGIGFIALAVGAGWAARQGVRYAADGYRRARTRGERRAQENQERLRQREEETNRRLADCAWAQACQGLQAEIDGVRTALEREALTSSLKAMEAPFRAALKREDGAAAEMAVNGMRLRIAKVRVDEQVLASQRMDLLRVLSRLERDAPAGFRAELEALRKDGEAPGCSFIEDKTQRVRELLARAHHLAGEVAQANAISLEGLEEERLFIPPIRSAHPSQPMRSVQSGQAQSAQDPALVAGLVSDICDFGARVAFFSQGEAEALKPLVLEAKKGAPTARLRLIRDQVKTTYGRLRERAVRTDLFKHDLQDFLPPLRRAQGETARKLCARMEDLLEAPVISSDEYKYIYKAVRVTMEEQMEAIADAMLAERVSATLEEMGYSLLDEDGAELTPGKMRTLATPYDGYRVQLKVTEAGDVATRFVRVVGSEEERAHLSEYQRQKDMEANKKWCRDLERFYAALEEAGLPMESAFRKEPGEEDLVLLVDPSLGRGFSAAQNRNQGNVKERWT